MGADRNPNGMIVSINILPSHSIPSSHLSCGWIGTFLYACWMSTFAIHALNPCIATSWAASSTLTYCSEHSFVSTPSLTLDPSGADKSTISLHFPGVPLGITPNLFICIEPGGNMCCPKGPMTLPAAHSAIKYSDTTDGFCSADLIFLLAHLHSLLN